MVTHRLHERNNVFYVVINDRDENGRRFQKWISTGLEVKNNKRKAIDKMAEIVAEYERAKEAPAAEQGASMADLVKQWLRVRKTVVRENTYNTYNDTATLHVIPYFEKLGISAKDLQPVHVQDYYTKKTEEGISPATMEKHRTVIKGSLDYAITTLQMIEHNPADRVTLPRKEKRIPKFYTRAQLLKLFGLVKGEAIETPVMLSGTYGLRRSEALGLQWSAVDFKRDTISIYHTAVRTGTRVLRADLTKSTASYRTMPLTKDMREHLKGLQTRQKALKAACGKGYTDNDYICKWDDGRPLEPDYVTHRFGDFLKEKGLDHIRFHDLRHSSASLLINEGFTLKEVQEWLGQASAASTEIYSHMLYKSKESMADKVNNALSMKGRGTPDNKKPGSKKRNGSTRDTGARDSR